jgi:hypothetical protein
LVKQHPPGVHLRRMYPRLRPRQILSQLLPAIAMGSPNLDSLEERLHSPALEATPAPSLVLARWDSSNRSLHSLVSRQSRAAPQSRLALALDHLFLLGPELPHKAAQLLEDSVVKANLPSTLRRSSRKPPMEVEQRTENATRLHQLHNLPRACLESSSLAQRSKATVPRKMTCLSPLSGT